MSGDNHDSGDSADDAASLAELFKVYRDAAEADDDAGEGEDGTPVPPWLADIYSDLGSTAEIAHILGVGKHRVNRWIERREKIHCPGPVRTLAHCNIYRLSDWIAWWRLYKLTLRPRAGLPSEPGTTVKASSHRGAHRHHMDRQFTPPGDGPWNGARR